MKAGVIVRLLSFSRVEELAQKQRGRQTIRTHCTLVCDVGNFLLCKKNNTKHKSCNYYLKVTPPNLMRGQKQEEQSEPESELLGLTSSYRPVIITAAVSITLTDSNFKFTTMKGRELQFTTKHHSLLTLPNHRLCV